MTSTADYEYVIVGAGPAGLQMAYFLQKAKRRYILFEVTEKAGSFFAQHPRHEKLISINKKYNLFDEEEFNLRHDWNSLLSDDKKMKFTEYSEELYPNPADLYRYLNDYAEYFKLNIKYNTEVKKVSKADGIFTVKSSSKEQDGGVTTSCSARCVLMATGAIEENIPDSIPGLELATTYSKHSLNKELYKNKEVLIIGGGNSAFEVGDYLSGVAGVIHLMCERKMKMAWDTHYVGDLRAVNNNLIDMYHLKSLHNIVGAQVQSIRQNEKGRFIATHKDLISNGDIPGYMYFDISYDHVISCLGWNYVKPDIFDDSIDIEYARKGRFPALSECWETKTENLFYIGAAMASIDKQSASGFIHGFRYNIRTLHNILENRFFSVPLPHEVIPGRALHTIALKVMDRATVSDALYQMNGFLCDVLVCDEEGNTSHYTDLPKGYIMQREEFNKANHVFVFHLSYGFEKIGTAAKPVDSVHAPPFTNNRCALFLHPFIEYHSYGKYVDQTELQGSLMFRYDEWACNNHPQWPTYANENYVKHFINEKMHWTDEVFNLFPVPASVWLSQFVPLTVEEKSRLPPLWEETECKPAQDLPKESSDAPKSRIRVLKPTREEVNAFAPNLNPK